MLEVHLQHDINNNSSNKNIGIRDSIAVSLTCSGHFLSMSSSIVALPPNAMLTKISGIGSLSIVAHSSSMVGGFSTSTESVRVIL